MFLTVMFGPSMLLQSNQITSFRFVFEHVNPVLNKSGVILTKVYISVRRLCEKLPPKHLYEWKTCQTKDNFKMICLTWFMFQTRSGL